jgi:hypothetical protein
MLKRIGAALGGTGQGRGAGEEGDLGSSLTPISISSTARAAWRPSRIAQTTRLCPRRMSPQAKICGSLVR